MADILKNIDEYSDVLRENGCRITPVVTAVLNLLYSKGTVVTTAELRDDVSMSLGYEVCSATLYRICERLARSGVLCSMHNTDGIMRYFICNRPSDKKHHHFICRKCLRVHEMDCNIDDKIRKTVSEKFQGTVENNFIQVEGICRDCMK